MPTVRSPVRTSRSKTSFQKSTRSRSGDAVNRFNSSTNSVIRSGQNSSKPFVPSGSVHYEPPPYTGPSGVYTQDNSTAGNRFASNSPSRARDVRNSNGRPFVPSGAVKYTNTTATAYSEGPAPRSPLRVDKFHSNEPSIPFRPSGSVDHGFSTNTSPLQGRSSFYRTSYDGQESDYHHEDINYVPKKQTSEYHSKYVEWDADQHQKLSFSPQKLKQLNASDHYTLNKQSVNWKSEQQDNFQPTKLNDYVAGVTTKDKETKPHSFAYRLLDHIAAEPYQAKSEARTEYEWPPKQGKIIYKNSPSKRLSEYQGDEMQVESHVTNYDEKLRQLREKQRAVMVNKDIRLKPAAGVRSQSSLETTNTKHKQVDMGTSEYKLQYIEWPLEERNKQRLEQEERLLSPKRQQELPGSKVFPATILDAYANDRKASEHREQFVRHDTTIAPTVMKPIEDANPRAFAWSLIDDHGKKAPVPNYYKSDLKLDAESEYKRRFNWPEVDHVQKFTHINPAPQTDEVGETIMRDIHHDNMDQFRTEYDDHYKDVSHIATRIEMDTTQKMQTNYPSQFAWYTSQDNNNEDSKKLLKKMSRKSHQPDSEHNAKFLWPTSVMDRQVIDKNKYEDNGPKIGQVFGLDEEDNDVRRWRSEYNDQTAYPLRINDDNQVIAGVPTQSKTQAPTFFAWEPLPPPPPMRNVADETPVDPNHFTTEYDEKFKKWRLEVARNDNLNKDEMKRAWKEGELNLFQEDDSHVGKPKSEYDEKFKRHASPTRDDEIARPAGVSSTSKDHVPKQFAWPPPPPTTVPTKTRKNTGPPETSEYETKFQWPAAADLVRAQKSEVEKLQHKDDPLQWQVEAGRSPENTWKSEYDDHADDRLKKQPKNKNGNKAGIITINQDEVPSFFAWAEDEEKKITPPPRPVFKGEVTRSEYEDAFQAYKNVPPPPLPANIRPISSEAQIQHINVLEDVSDARPTSLPRSEYESQFRGFDGGAGRPPAVTVMKELESNRPPQFAWPLVDQPETSITPVLPRPTGVFKEKTEYDSKFHWPSGETQLSKKDQARERKRIEMTGADTLKLDDGQLHDTESQWRSEYDDRCIQLRRKQREMMDAANAAALAHKNQTAGISTAVGIDAPAFYAWDIIKPPQVPDDVPIRSTSRERSKQADSTEYQDNFKKFSNKSTASMKSTQIPLSNTFNHFQFGGKKFEGVTEYDDQFITKQTIDSQASNVDNNHNTLQGTNLHPQSSDKLMLSQRPSSTTVTFTNNKHKVPATEQQEMFQWPTKSEEKTTPVLHASSSRVRIGKQIPVHPYSTTTTTKVSTSTSISSSENDKENRHNNVTQLNKKLQQAKDKDKVKEKKQQENKIVHITQQMNNKLNQYNTYQTESQSAFDWPSHILTATNALKRGKDKYTLMKHKKSHVPPDRSYMYKLARNRSNSFSTMDATMSDAFTTGSNAHNRKKQHKTVINGHEDEYVERPNTATSTVTNNTVMTQDSLNNNNNNTTTTFEHKVFPVESIPIPGLRGHDESIASSYRSRSAPPRRLISNVPFESTNQERAYIDDSTSNPILMYRRYPPVSDRQVTRWSTETMDKFRTQTEPILQPRQRRQREEQHRSPSPVNTSFGSH